MHYVQHSGFSGHDASQFRGALLSGLRLLGIGFGATNCVYPVAISKSFGPKYGGSIYGTGMWAYMIFATLLMPQVNSAIVAATGSWNLVFAIAIILNLISLASMLLIPKVDRAPLKKP